MQYNIILLRVFALHIIVLFHCLCFYSTNWGIGFIVDEYDYIANLLVYPGLIIFTAISGYLFSFNQSSFSQLLKKKGLRLILHYFFWLLTGHIIAYLFNSESIGLFIGHLWYLKMLFFCFIITWLIRSIIVRISPKILFLICIVITPFYYRVSWSSDLSLFLMYFPTFFIGYMWSFIAKWTIKTNKAVILLALIVFLTVVISILLRINGLYSYLQRIMIFMSSLNATLLFVLTKQRSWCKEIASYKYVRLINKSSMGIYLVHHIIIGSLLGISACQLFLIEHYRIGPFILFAVVMSLSLVIIYSINKIRIIKQFV